jgi:glycosyltransferase involved in cell wall biosynthesis
VYRVFGTRRLFRWSLGVDGKSSYQRDLNGNPIGGSPLQNAAGRIADLLVPASRRPTRMIHQWSEDLRRLLTKLQPTSSDILLINTADDFALLALAAALQRLELPPLRIHALLHFALYDSAQGDRTEHMRQLGRQLRASLQHLSQHHVQLHATSDALAEQIRELESGHRIRSIPYPTRPCQLSAGSEGPRLNAMIAGMPRAEKGKDAIPSFLAEIEEGLLKQGRYRLSLQLPPDRWRSMVPASLQRSCEEAMPGQSKRTVEIITSHLSTEAYHRWLSTADLGLFLYDPKRYEARCSGVLLEMLARGVPVIVPDHCWLAQQVRQAGGHRSIGFIYQDRSEIPDLMRQFAARRDEILPRSKAHAASIAKRHNGRNSLLAMGIQPADQRQHAA